MRAFWKNTSTKFKLMLFSGLGFIHEVPCYQAIIIDLSLERVPVGCYLLMNLSPLELRGFVGSNQVVVSAEGVTQIIPSSVDEGFLDVHFEYESPEGWKTFARTRWVNKTGKCSLLLAYQDPKTKRMKIKGIPIWDQ